MQTERVNLSPIDDQNRHFRTEHLEKNLGSRSARGGAVTLAAQLIKFAIATAGAIVLARLLTPEDYGLIGMVVIVVNFVGMFPFLGLSTATMRWSELNHQQVSVLFWVNIALSAFVMLVALACAPVLAWFYDEPRLIGIMAGYALTILLSGLYIQHEAILSRQMRFAAISIIEIVAMLIGFVSAIAAAGYGARYWSLVINQLVMTVVTIIGVWAACRWRPGLPTRGAGVHSMLSYGGYLTGFNVTTYLARNLDNALIGKFWGAAQLGVYSRAYQMLLMPMQQINAPFAAVAIPGLSRLADSPERYRAAYLKILQKIAMLTMPLVAFMIVTSDWLVEFLLGPAWRDAGRIFMLLGIAAIMQPVTKTTWWLFSTQGRAKELFRWGLIAGAIATLAIVAGLPWGATGVATAYAVSDLCLTTPLLFWYVGRKGPVRTGDFYRTIAPFILTSLVVLGTLFVARPWLEIFQHLFTRLTMAFGFGLAISFLLLMVLPASRDAMRSIKEMLSTMVRRNQPSTVPAAPPRQS